jgi:hypothetical protein
VLCWVEWASLLQAKILKTYQACPDFLNLEGVDEPLGQVVEEEEDGDLTAGLGKRVVGGRKHLENGGSEFLDLSFSL